MTSYREYDYDIVLNLDPAIFRDIAGVALGIDILFNGFQKLLSGMLIIPHSSPSGPVNNNTPQIQDFSEKGIALVEAWMWTDDFVDIPIRTKISLKLGQPCDPAIEPFLKLGEYGQELLNYQGLILEGTVMGSRNLKKLDFNC
jgi:hypothetical protein